MRASELGPRHRLARVVLFPSWPRGARRTWTRGDCERVGFASDFTSKQAPGCRLGLSVYRCLVAGITQYAVGKGPQMAGGGGQVSYCNQSLHSTNKRRYFQHATVPTRTFPARMQHAARSQYAVSTQYAELRRMRRTQCRQVSSGVPAIQPT